MGQCVQYVLTCTDPLTTQESGFSTETNIFRCNKCKPVRNWYISFLDFVDSTAHRLFEFDELESLPHPTEQKLTIWTFGQHEILADMGCKKEGAAQIFGASAIAGFFASFFSTGEG